MFDASYNEEFAWQGATSAASYSFTDVHTKIGARTKFTLVPCKVKEDK
jgi:hypothetical protein